MHGHAALDADHPSAPSGHGFGRNAYHARLLFAGPHGQTTRLRLRPRVQHGVGSQGDGLSRTSGANMDCRNPPCRSAVLGAPVPPEGAGHFPDTRHTVSPSLAIRVVSSPSPRHACPNHETRKQIAHDGPPRDSTAVSREESLVLPFACALPANAATTKSEQLTVPSTASCAIAGADAAAGASFKGRSEPSRYREVQERMREP